MSEIVFLVSEDDEPTRRVAFVRGQMTVRRIFIGRDSRCDVVLGDRRVSRVHVLVEVDEVTGEVLLVDLCSTRGTRLSGKVVNAEELMPGEAFVVGDAARISFCWATSP
jgi:pSer/pThr/pTyr-binding forkhead associated (FHA) protein